MRITQIDLKNFRAFYGEYSIKLDNAGKNLLVYGENGSGKSSLYFALKYFLNSHQQHRSFGDYRNIYVKDDEDGYLKLALRRDTKQSLRTFEWSETRHDTDDVLILDAAKSSGFLDYKRLLETYFLAIEGGRVNFFELLVENLLAHSETPDGKTIGETWQHIKNGIPKRNTQRTMADLEHRVADFNGQLTFKLNELKDKTSEILKFFKFKLDLEFSSPDIVYERHKKRLSGQEILLSTKLYDKDTGPHHSFLNEAKLSAIALSIYFASLLVSPNSNLNILVLDDVLIGLDMSNRLPVIDILKAYFGDYQVFFFTYDRAWFEMMRLRTEESRWKCLELYAGKTDDREMPVFKDKQENLQKAKYHLDNHDLKASVIYVRTALEVVLKKGCDGKIPVRYQIDPRKYNLEHFWQGVKESGKLEDAALENAKTYLKFLLNPLSHSNEINPARQEIEDAIEAVTRLDEALNPKKTK